MTPPENKSTNILGITNQKLLLKPKKKMVKSKISKSPNLRWGKDDTKGILSSGLNPFKKTRISLLDEAQSKNKVSLIIEPSCPGTSV
jgi:hypothetical protein